MAWGTFTCRRHVRRRRCQLAVFKTRMNELMPLALRNTEAFALYAPTHPLRPDDGRVHAVRRDKGMRRFRARSVARGASARGHRCRNDYAAQGPSPVTLGASRKVVVDIDVRERNGPARY